MVRGQAGPKEGMVPSLFISHSSEDRPVAEALTRRLAAEGLRSYFLDVDPEQGIRVGRSWERELYTELRRADAVLYLSSASSDVSRWCFAELALARSAGTPVFPVLLDGGGNHPLLRDTQYPLSQRQGHGLQRGSGG
jgi:hypothetical protein